MESASPNSDFVLFSLDDHELDQAIAHQESVLKSVPSAARYMEPALAAHRAERQRRNAATNAATNEDLNQDRTSDDVEDVHEPQASHAWSPLAPVSKGGTSPPPTRIAACKKRACVTPYADKRPVRVRFGPLRYGSREERGIENVSAMSPELRAQHEANKVTRAQLRTNQEFIEDTAVYFRCALTARKPRKVRVTPNGTRHDRPVVCPYLGAQAKKLAVADDGYYYDFSHITQYIRDNVHRQLRSPVTGDPMGSQVYHVVKCTTGKGTRAVKGTKTATWTPEIFVREEIPEPETASDSDGPAPPSAPEGVLVVD